MNALGERIADQVFPIKVSIVRYICRGLKYKSIATEKENQGNADAGETKGNMEHVYIMNRFVTFVRYEANYHVDEYEMRF